MNICAVRAIDSLHLHFFFFFIIIELATFQLLCKIIDSRVCINDFEEDLERVCKTLMRSINASTKRDGSIGPKIHSLADAYSRDDVTPKGGNPGRPHLARLLPRLCSNNQWTWL